MKINDVLKPTVDYIQLKGLHRILWINQLADEVVLIQVPNVAAGETLPYFRRPRSYRLSEIKNQINAAELVTTSFRLAGIFTMSDEQLSRRYPGRNGDGANILKHRNEAYKEILTLVNEIQNHPRAFFHDGDYNKRIHQHAIKAKKGTVTYKNAVHRYLALACGQNALLPFTFACGAKGKERKQRRPLGNTTKAYKAGLVESAGFALDYEAKQNLGWGYYAFMKKDASLEDAYDQTMALFWSDGDKIVDGQAVPVLLPAHRRPSFFQFKSWGPRLFENEDAWKIHLGFRDFESNYRGYIGSAMDGVSGVGQFGLCDATSIDDQLSSRFSRMRPIGSAVRMAILEGFSTSVTGYHLGLTAPSSDIALLAVLSAATSKVDYCARYGVEISEDDIPAVHCCRYIVDNGEYRSTKVIRALTSVGSGVEFVSIGRGDRKPQVEAMHRTLHAKTGHRIRGTTRGRLRKRGEDAPALHACWTIDERIRLDLQAIRYINTAMPVEAFFNSHPFRAQMKADGVRPYRSEIHAWGVQNGFVYSPPFHEDRLRAALLPRMKAVITENGIHLRRPDCGARLDLIKGPRFVGKRLQETGLMEKARLNGVIRAEVGVNENDLSCVWYTDEAGIHQLKNASNDLGLTRTGTLKDCLAIQDSDAIERELDRDYTDQKRAEFTTMRQTNDAHYYREKQREIAAQDKRPSKAQLTRNVRSNRERELAASPDTACKTSQLEDPAATDRDSTPDHLDAALRDHRRDG